MITLTKDLEIGVAKIDEQHKELIDRINTITSMGTRYVTKEETQNTLDLLDKYVVQHFCDEEALQKECNYPKYEWHKEIHQNFISDFMNVKEEFSKNGASMKFTIELNNRIISWIVKHIKNVDVEFGKYYASQGYIK
jgi:hemerythrin-like metal-binding protein